jgi:hypothetical protein
VAPGHAGNISQTNRKFDLPGFHQKQKGTFQIPGVLNLLDAFRTLAAPVSS